MRPNLFHWGDISIPSYGAMFVLGYVVAFVVVHLLSRHAPHTTRAQVTDLFIVMTLASVIGSKVGHVLFEFGAHPGPDGQPLPNVFALLKEDPWHWLRLLDPGYVWYGGMVTALVSAVVYFKRRPQLVALEYADTFAPAVAFGACIGRIGCFLAGCCQGRVTDHPIGVVFPGRDHAVFPTQLFDSASALLIGLFLTWRFLHRRFSGEVVCWLLILYPIFRGATEIFRGDDDRGSFGPLSTSQWISIPMFLTGLFLFWKQKSKKPHQN